MYTLQYFDEEIGQWEPIEEYTVRGEAIDGFVKARCAVDRDYRDAKREPKIRLVRNGSKASISNNGV